MNRFLPAANALAARSTPALPKHRTHRTTLSHRLQKELIESRQRSAAAAAVAATNAFRSKEVNDTRQPSKACGFPVFFPWTFNQTPCGLRRPVHSHTPRPVLNGSNKTSGRFGTRDDDNVSCKACGSPGRGLPFLDTSRLRLRTRNDGEIERGRQQMGVVSGSTKWSLPSLKTPSEPWLSHARQNANKRY
ncbi:hypothetical protein HPP92_018100 [Vanilla planifolia]|uniref:Uncharacterized protein n=1 Tax=Vanilla planifolia TaxID=51239 RepID=A0A835Q547_VANPL|nr:hypothetical protein HPP92_018100 [Vanilla planifolia]